MKKLLLAVFLITVSNLCLAKTILLTNDDGYTAPGITALYDALVKAGHDVTLVAPASQQSGASASVSSRDLELVKHADNIYSVTGRPSDAARVGLAHVMKDNPPDIVISGINFGQNAGHDVIVSGTVGAATTAFQLGFPAISVSTEIKFKELQAGFPSTLAAMPDTANFIVRVLEYSDRLPKNAILNINYPARKLADIQGAVATTLANYSVFDGTYKETDEGKLNANFNLKPSVGRGTDAYELAQGYITLTRLDGGYGMKPNRGLKNLARKLEP